jgi:MazG family protein
MSAGDEFARLVQIMRDLRAKCPWDRSQTHDTLRPYLVEEAYEVLEALDEGRYDELREELGDLMLQIVFHAELAEEDGRFDIEAVLKGINEKLVRRHPHVFGDAEAETPGDVYRRWEKIKVQEEKKTSSLSGVPAALPALSRASRVLAKIRQTGVDPFAGRDPTAEMERWMQELRSAGPAASRERCARAAGMLALALAEATRRMRVDAEDSLRETTSRMVAAFMDAEAAVRTHDEGFAALSDDELRRMGQGILDACEGEDG